MKKKYYVLKDENIEVERFYLKISARLYCWYLNKFDKTSKYFVAILLC
jgi:hypothetical protein